MFKRILLSLTFLAAFGAAGLLAGDEAQARRWGWGRSYATYYAPGPYYSYGVPYGAYPRYVGRPYYYGYPAYYYGRPRVAIRVGPWWW